MTLKKINKLTALQQLIKKKTKILDFAPLKLWAHTQKKKKKKRRKKGLLNSNILEVWTFKDPFFWYFPQRRLMFECPLLYLNVSSTHV